MEEDYKAFTKDHIRVTLLSRHKYIDDIYTTRLSAFVYVI